MTVWRARKIFLAAMLCLVSVVLAGASVADDAVGKTGHYAFKTETSPKVRIFYALPGTLTPETPVLFVIPGARRNADVYRDAWQPYAQKHGFAVMTLECTLKHCPTEYSYNAGGVTDRKGKMQPEENWLFSVLDPAFEDFKTRYKLNAEAYALYGHSAGGSFVHMFMMFKPHAKVSRAVSANAAFFAMPSMAEDYPFGFKNIKPKKTQIKKWLASDLTILLGEEDTGPRTKALSNGPKGRAQGSSVYARGLLFHHNGLSVAAQMEIDLNWTLDIAHGVGHSNKNMIPHALDHLDLDMTTGATP